MADPTIPIPPPPPPHPDSRRLARGIRRCLPLVTRLTGVIYRVASVRRANPEDLIAGIGSQLTGGRWTPPGAFRAVYASRDEATALDEARQQNLRQGVPPWMALPLVLTALEVDLGPALDLTDGRVRRTLRVSRDRMLAEPWWLLQDRGQEAAHPGDRPARPRPRLRGPPGPLGGAAPGDQRRDLSRSDCRGPARRREPGPAAAGAGLSEWANLPAIFFTGRQTRSTMGRGFRDPEGGLHGSRQVPPKDGPEADDPGLREGRQASPQDCSCRDQTHRGPRQAPGGQGRGPIGLDEPTAELASLGPARVRGPERAGSDPGAVRPVDRLLRARHHRLGGRATDQRAGPASGQGDGRLRAALAEVMREEFIPQWLQAPCEGLGGLKPVEALERGEVDRLWRVILLIGSGMPT